MKGYFRRRGCTCKKKKCTCGAKWSFTIDVGIDPKTGKRRQKTKSGFTTKPQAEEACAALIYEMQHGTHIKESNIVFKDFAKEWLQIYQKTHKVKISTVRIRQHEINNLIPYFGFLKLKDVSKKKYQEALNDLQEKGFAANTISGIHATGRMIFRLALEYELISKDPTEFAKLPKTQKTVEELERETEVLSYLEKEELALFLMTSREKGLEKDFITFLTLAYTGMRAGELCALKWRDIDFEAGTISITKTLYNPNNNPVKYNLLTPKTRKSKRVIDVDKAVLEELKRHKAKQNAYKMEHRDTYHDEDFVFAKTKKYPGYPELIKIIENRMRRLLKLAGLNEALTPHSLRHTHTSLLAEAGADITEIMDRLGHEDDSTTKRVYLHVTQSRRKDAAKRFSELMRSL